MDLRKHRSHDYVQLIRRWRAVARKAGMPVHFLARAGKYDTWYLKSKALRPTGGLYISTGIHGDEPAGPEALVTWAEKNARMLQRIPCLIFPCLNPWGIVNNRRLDQEGRDLNRLFHRDDVPVVSAVKTLVKQYQFDVSLMMHEDYDGQGIYLYETERAHPFWAESLIKIAQPFIPIDRRERIDLRKCNKPGIVRRKVIMKRFLDIGFPEAIHLHLFYSIRTFTVETPSEFALDQRVAAHMAIIEECVSRVLARE
ncbi:MAG TPA: M14 family metallocarboxypeptidase [Chthoniobacteraceae bacterium]|nr:M14 family metallocarboxypeptidase [Chthoniobacteraceae bacterium]